MKEMSGSEFSSDSRASKRPVAAWHFVELVGQSRCGGQTDEAGPGEQVLTLRQPDALRPQWGDWVWIALLDEKACRPLKYSTLRWDAGLLFLPLFMFKIQLLEMPPFNLIISVRERERERAFVRMLTMRGCCSLVAKWQKYLSRYQSACSTSRWAHEGAEVTTQTRNY